MEEKAKERDILPKKKVPLQPGDRVVMINCAEARDYPEKEWIVRSEPWELGCGEEVVLLEGKGGGFATRCLRKVGE